MTTRAPAVLINTITSFIIFIQRKAYKCVCYNNDAGNMSRARIISAMDEVGAHIIALERRQFTRLCCCLVAWGCGRGEGEGSREGWGKD